MPKPRFELAIQTGLHGNAELMALAARPPKNGDPSRANAAIQAIRDVSAWLYYDNHGHDNPGNPRRGNRTYKDRVASLYLVFDQFFRSVEAGRIFSSSLLARERGDREQEVTIRLKHEGATIPFVISAVPHALAIERLYDMEELRHPGIEKTNVRKEAWDRWLPSIYIAASYAIIFDSNGFKGLPIADWRSLCWSVIFNEDNRHLRDRLIYWCRELEAAALEQRLFPKKSPASVRPRIGTSAISI